MKGGEKNMCDKSDKAAEWAEENSKELAQYKLEWVIVSENGIVSHDEDLGEALEALDEAGLALDEVAMIYVDESFGGIDTK